MRESPQLPRCTLDTSSAIALDYLGLIPRLSLLFAKVLLPWAVRQELYQRDDREQRILVWLRHLEFLEECERYDQLAVTFLLAERNRPLGKDRGEVEAVVQAAEIGADVVIDDRWGRKLAEQYRLTPRGTLWVLGRLFDMQFFSSDQVTDGLQRLFQEGVRLPAPAVEELLQHVRDKP